MSTTNRDRVSTGVRDRETHAVELLGSIVLMGKALRDMDPEALVRRLKVLLLIWEESYASDGGEDKALEDIKRLWGME